MKSIAKHSIGIAILSVLIQFNYLTAQNDVIQYAICQNCNENNPVMGEPINYTIDQISSDYGMRVAGGGTRFHRGIDYVPPPNASVVAVRGGEISSIVGTGLKSITIRHRDGTYYSYLHIFGNNIPSNPPANFIRYGAFVLHRIEGTGRFAILNLASGQGYCHHPNDVNRIITYHNRQFTLTRNVEAGDAIAPVGTSGINGEYPYHLHISKIENGVTMPDDRKDYWNSKTHSVDPWTSIATRNTTLTSRIRTRSQLNYSGNIPDHDRGQSEWGNIELLYPNSNNANNPYGRNVLQVEVGMENAERGDRDDRYTNVVMDADVVKVEISKNGQNQWQTITGSNYHGYIRQNPNPAGNLTVYPDRMFNNYGNITRNSNGIVPFAYRTIGDNMAGQTTNNFNGGFHPSDYYLFTDIYTRLKSGHTPTDNSTALQMPNILGDSPISVKYKDGLYNMRSNVINIHGNSIQSNPSNFTIDNFPPYLDQIEIRANNRPFYQITRIADEGVTATLHDGRISNSICSHVSTFEPNQSNTMTVQVVSSEPLSNLSMQAFINDIATTNIITMTATNTERTNWQGQFTLRADPGNLLAVQFIGTDLSSNQLLNIHAATNNNGTQTTLLPTRSGQTPTSWVNYG